MPQLFSYERWSLKGINWWMCCLLLSLAFGESCDDHVLAANAKAAAFPGTLTLQEGKLTARIAAIPLRQVITEVARLSDAQVLWLGPQDLRPVSVAFSSLSIAEALERLLPQKNFLLLYASKDNDARLRQIWISSPGAGVAELQITKRPPLTEQPQTTEQPEVMNDDPPAEADPEFNAVLDAHIETVLRETDANYRIEAIEALSGMSGSDARIRPLLAQLANTEQDAQVRGAAEEALAGLE